MVFDEALLGEWREAKENPDEGAKWSFTKGEIEKVYRVRIEEDDLKLDLNGRLFNLGGHRLLDLHSRGRSITEIPAHHLFRIMREGPSIQIQILNIEWVRNWIRENPNSIAHVIATDPENPNDQEKMEYILTADTERLQKFVLEHVNDKNFFGDSTQLKPQRK